MKEARGVIIDEAMAGRLTKGWQTELLIHGDVSNRLGALLMDVPSIDNALANEGEIEFRCWSTVSGASEAFMKTLEQPTGMPDDKQGGLKSRQERMNAFEIRNQTMPCETHRRIGCLNCPVP